MSKGKHDHSYHRVSDKDEKFMEDHINSYEPGISHYRRKHAPHVLYVDPSLTNIDMYDAYKKKCELKDHKVLSLSTYTGKIKSMNISFAKLGHEECEMCIKYDEHSCLSDSVETKCACYSLVNQQKKGKNECIWCRKYSKTEKKKRSQRKKNTECSKISAEAVCKCCKVHNEMAQLKSIEAAGCDGCAKYAEHVQRKIESRQC